MSSTQQQSKHSITLKGSAQIVSEFFGFSINTILYLRGIYQPEAFESRQKYGVPMMVARDPGLNRYLGTVLQKVAEWLMQGAIQRLAIVISSERTGDVLERWDFDVQQDREQGAEPGVSTKPMEEINSEIRALVRQITASVSFLPVLSEPCLFDILVYTDPDIATPDAWRESDALEYIADSAEVTLRSFTTRLHRVGANIRYRAGADEL